MTTAVEEYRPREVGDRLEEARAIGQIRELGRERR